MRQLHQRSRAGISAPGLLILGVGLAATVACYPSGVDSVTDYNTVTTAYDSTYDFKSLSTYSIPGATPSNPSNCVIKDLGDGGTVNTTNASTVCNTVVNQLNSLGYTLVPDGTTNPTAPSFVVTLGFLSQSYTAWVSYPWYGYWGGYYPGYGWGGWGVYYPYYSYVYSYDVGTITGQMTVPDSSASKMKGVWGFALNGVETPPNNTPTVIQAGIVQAFTQSPYLGK